MALRNMREIGDEILLKRSKEVKKISRRDLNLIEDMLDTMYDKGGLGLAAPQIGVLKRIVVIHGAATVEENSNDQSEMAGEDDYREATDEEEIDPIILINPVIIKEEGSQTGEEGCLSVPGKWGIVTRPDKIIVRAHDVDMVEFELEAEEILARAICHEVDHLNGKLYVDLVEGELRDADDRDDNGEEDRKDKGTKKNELKRKRS